VEIVKNEQKRAGIGQKEQKRSANRGKTGVFVNRAFLGGEMESSEF